MQVNLESLPIDDLVSEACCGGNLVALVLNIKTRLMNHKNVLTEIQELQRKWVLCAVSRDDDWRYNVSSSHEGKVTKLFSRVITMFIVHLFLVVVFGCAQKLE